MLSSPAILLLPQMGAGTAEKGAGTQQQLLPLYLLFATSPTLVVWYTQKWCHDVNALFTAWQCTKSYEESFGNWIWDMRACSSSSGGALALGGRTLPGMPGVPDDAFDFQLGKLGVSSKEFQIFPGYYDITIIITFKNSFISTYVNYWHDHYLRCTQALLKWAFFQFLTRSWLNRDTTISVYQSSELHALYLYVFSVWA